MTMSVPSHTSTHVFSVVSVVCQVLIALSLVFALAVITGAASSSATGEATNDLEEGNASGSDSQVRYQGQLLQPSDMYVTSPLRIAI
jgi:hypothetical protein